MMRLIYMQGSFSTSLLQKLHPGPQAIQRVLPNAKNKGFVMQIRQITHSKWFVQLTNTWTSLFQWRICGTFETFIVYLNLRHNHPLNWFRESEQDRNCHYLSIIKFSGKCARRGHGCNENTKFRPVITDWTCYKNYEPCPKESQVGWCNKCWCNKGYIAPLLDSSLTNIGITLTRTFCVANLIY